MTKIITIDLLKCGKCRLCGDPYDRTGLDHNQCPPSGWAPDVQWLTEQMKKQQAKQET